MMMDVAMLSQGLVLVPIVVACLWILVRKWMSRHQTTRDIQAPIWINLKVKGMAIHSFHELSQSLIELGFVFESQHQIFNFYAKDLLYMRCLNIEKPGKFDIQDGSKRVTGLMLVTDLSALPEVVWRACLTQMQDCALALQTQYGGSCMDETNYLDEATWVERQLTKASASGKQQDLLTT
jgi:hypothetical protein